MVSLTAANTSRMFEVSVAWVRLDLVSITIDMGSRFGRGTRFFEHHLLWIQIEMRPVHLVEPPQQILCSPVHIVASRVVRKVMTEG